MTLTLVAAVSMAAPVALAEERHPLAGSGLEGAAPLVGADDGRGRNMLAYVRMLGQRCLYNVWSRLGRAHLELLLDGLRAVPVRR